MNKLNLSLALILILSSLSTKAQLGVKLSDVEILNRCYLKLFKSIRPRTSGSLAQTLQDQIYSKKITGSEACSILLDQAQFNDNQTLVTAKFSNYPKLSELENRNLLSNLHNFHNSWFTKKSFEVDAQFDKGTYLMRDNDEPALYITRALFGSDVKVSTLFTSNETLRGIRQTPDQTPRWLAKPMTVLNEEFFKPINSSGLLLALKVPGSTVVSQTAVADQDLVPFGFLTGVEVAKALTIPSIKTASQRISVAVNGKKASELTTEYRTAITSVSDKATNIHEHLGGGILGSQMFILKNSNLEYSQTAPGVLNDPDDQIARRISKRVFEDLMCQEVPTLTQEDVLTEVKPTSSHGFRKAASCMACHVSIDPMAYSFRKFMMYRSSEVTNSSSEDDQKKGTTILGVTSLPTVANSEVFSLKPASGSLNYRDHDGTLIKVPVADLSDMGLKISQSDDFYRCVTKKYYQFLVGKEIRLVPTASIPASQLTEEYKFHRKKIFTLATELKQHQSLKTLIKAIVSSEGFQYRYYQSSVGN